jgi:hypothetical protein
VEGRGSGVLCESVSVCEGMDCEEIASQILDASLSAIFFPSFNLKYLRKCYDKSFLYWGKGWIEKYPSSHQLLNSKISIFKNNQSTQAYAKYFTCLSANSSTKVCSYL